MLDTAIEHAKKAIACLAERQGLMAVINARLEVDIDKIESDVRKSLLSKIVDYAQTKTGPMLMLSLPPQLQSEFLLFGETEMPGIDRTAYIRATPKQIVRLFLKREDERILENYQFSRIGKHEWEEYLVKCSSPIKPAIAFLSKAENAGGFSDEEVANIALCNGAIAGVVPAKRLNPNAALSLLISGRAEHLWKQYDFSRFGKNHWRELFLHTNPAELPKESLRFIENRDGNGFAESELLQMAYKCHALINFLNPEKISFDIAYDLFLTGKGDILWKNFPFEKLDKRDWQKLLGNNLLRIPSTFTEVMNGGMFTVEEICKLAIINEKLFPFIIAANFSPKNIVDILLETDGAYLWDNYSFSRFRSEDWERLILGLKEGVILRPRAMSAFIAFNELTEELVTKAIRKDFAYHANMPIKLIAPDVAADLFVNGKGNSLWTRYDFGRFDRMQLRSILKVTAQKRTWPESLAACLNESGKPLTFGDLLEISTANPRVVLCLISAEWLGAMGVDLFKKLVDVATRTSCGCDAIIQNLKDSSLVWRNLSRAKLKVIGWKVWPCRDVVDLVRANPIYGAEYPHGKRLFWHLHWFGLLLFAVLTCGAIYVIAAQNKFIVQHTVNNKRWNAIVEKVSELDRKGEYEALGQYLQTLAPEDLAIVKDDVIYKNALFNMNKGTSRELFDDLLARMNKATTYEEYFAARESLSCDFKNMPELASLIKESLIAVVDANKEVKSDDHDGQSYSYDFVGVIKLDVAKPNDILISGCKGLKGKEVVLYTLRNIGTFGVRAIPVVRRTADGKYKKFRGVDSSYRGLPLFVRKGEQK